MLTESSVGPDVPAAPVSAISGPCEAVGTNANPTHLVPLFCAFAFEVEGIGGAPAKARRRGRPARERGRPALCANVLDEFVRALLPRSTSRRAGRPVGSTPLRVRTVLFRAVMFPLHCYPHIVLLLTPRVVPLSPQLIRSCSRSSLRARAALPRPPDRLPAMRWSRRVRRVRDHR